MSEKKNIVIKVKYPTAGKADGLNNPVTGNTSQWNYGRIALFLGSLILLVSTLSYFVNKDVDDKSPVNNAEISHTEQPQTQLQSQSAIIGNNNAISPATTPQNTLIVRSQLTTDINKNEPVDTLKLPLKIGKTEKIGIYYFLEIKGMKGKAVTHEWLLNGEIVSHKKVNISSDPWRTASKQLITYTMNNDWLVRLVDDAGNKIDEKSFNLELK